MKTNPEEQVNGRTTTVFKALAAFSRERCSDAGVDELDQCHWADVARMIRKTVVNELGDQTALEPIDIQGFSRIEMSDS
jgi:hypothetical protein